MIHSVDKPKDMARSILPSDWRGASQARARLHRSERRAVQQSLRALTRDPESWNGGVDFGEEVAVEISTLVRDRRSADKLNHFERWAVERTRGLPKEHRLGHLRAVLPAGLIGQHALLHLERVRELAPERPRRVWPKWKPPYLDFGLVAVVLREVLETGGAVRQLHRVMKAPVRIEGGRVVMRPFRALRGVHDVSAFLSWLGEHLDVRAVVDGFVAGWREGRRPD